VSVCVTLTAEWKRQLRSFSKWKQSW